MPLKALRLILRSEKTLTTRENRLILFAQDRRDKQNAHSREVLLLFSFP
ncbi:unnamed protein product [Linum tenue]|uniref:Uncharacterized protein n=1 Tax=Linum tenue TaxID=586396 RepID=A0AAV0QQL3_9ROSI|nr:unnamed protein product [Linum tenue]